MTFREIVSDSIRYWERMRLFYNAALILVAAAVFYLAWPESRAAVSVDTAQTLFLLAVLANVAYCSAYVVDLFAQYSSLRPVWLRYRWVLLVVGILFAAILTNFISSGLFHTQAMQPNQPLEPTR